MERKSKYTGVAIALGAALGVVFGVVAGNMGAWLAVGVAIGVAIGATLRPKKAECPQCEQVHRTHEVARR